MGAEKKTTYVLEAQDKFSATFGDFRKQLNGVQNDTASLRGHLDGMAGGLNTLGFSFRALFGLAAAGGFAALIKETIESEANLLKVSRATGMTVEALSGLMPSAKEAGLGLEEVAKLSQKLSRAMVESQDPHSKAAAAMRAIGVSALDTAGHLKAPEQMALDVAKALNKFEDGAGKVAVAQDFMGKSGANALPWMAALAEKGELSAKVTKAQALEAKKFEDQLHKLQARSSAAARDMANGLLPALNDVLGALRGVAGERDSSIGFWGSVGEVVRFATIGIAGAWHAIENFGTRMLALARAAKEAYTGTWQGAIDALKAGDAQVAANDAKFADFTANVLKSSKVFGDGAEAFKGAEETKRKALRYTGTAHDARNKAYTDELAAQREKIALLGSGGEVEAYRFKLEKEQFKELTPQKREELLNLEREFVSKKRLAEFQKQINAGDSEVAQIYEKNREAGFRLLATQRESLAVAKLEFEQLGHTREEREHAMLNLERERALRGVLDEDVRKGINSYFDERDALIELTKAKQDSLSVWGEVADRGAKLFADMAMAGKGAFDVLKRELRNFASEMLAFFAKKFLLQMIAGLVGGGTGSALAGQAASSGAGTLAGSAANAAGSYIGGAGTAIGGAYGASEGFAMGWASGVAAPTAGFAETAGAWASNVAGGLVTAEGALSATGWGVIIAAVIAVVAYFATRNAGGDKFGGSYMGQFDASGNLTGGMNAPGTQNGRFFTPNQGDAQMREIVTAIGRSYAEGVKAFGGTAGAFGFGLGFDTDPRGRAPDRFSSAVTDANGRLIYGNTNASPADGQKMGEAMTLEGQRMVLRALQESNLPPAIVAILKTVDAISSTAEKIQGVYALATAFKQLSDTLGDFSLDKILTFNRRDSGDVFSDQGAALGKFADQTKFTVEGINALTAATNQYKQAAAQVIIVLEQTRLQVAAMFDATARNIRLSTMDKSQQYNFYQAEAAQASSQLANATSAEEITRLTNTINTDINAAWALLSPEQQRALQSEFLTRLETTSTRAQDRARELQVKAAADAKIVLDRIEGIMTRAALALTTAAQTVSNQHVTVHLVDNRSGGGLTTDGSP